MKSVVAYCYPQVDSVHGPPTQGKEGYHYKNHPRYFLLPPQRSGVGLSELRARRRLVPYLVEDLDVAEHDDGERDTVHGEGDEEHVDQVAVFPREEPTTLYVVIVFDDGLVEDEDGDVNDEGNCSKQAKYR